ncbi:hypothetical protein P3F83_23530 [Mycobacteroides immunogenum]|uniref:hypothetical protein n=1 Tax=Mycobacteroides immunogenum TaxID=83262 RepID=UPI0025B78425|nr:hypothetical protein [Mycobacteroides immunogenum]WJR33383.1 hypothetical protein P3F83_23530 [Mycobacteroides immunogenum]
MKAAFQDAQIPATPKGEHPAMTAFAVCLMRTSATHKDVVLSLREGDLKSFTNEQVEAVVTISEQLWCQGAPLK